MKITKLGHCCMVLETKGIKILTDPGVFTTEQNQVTNVDLVLITHEHADHFHVESVKAIIQNNPQVKIITNQSVGKLLAAENIPFEVVEHGQMQIFKGVLIEGFGNKHAVIYRDNGMVQNTGFFMDDKLFFPGDAFFNPGKAVEILALPVAGPWMKISDAIDFALEVHPKVVFPVHDGMLSKPEIFYKWPEKVLGEQGIEFRRLEVAKETEF
jgi:L-ascorbate metabolism protein UlaG (beta-lactamase superfamily)